MDASIKKFRTVGQACAAIALALVLSCSITACGGGSGGSTSGGDAGSGASATSAPREGSANVDPAELEAGYSEPDDAKITYTDYWYVDGEKTPALYFQNNSVMTPVFLNEDGSEKTVKTGTATIKDGHIVPEGEADPTYDIVFDDPFTCYDFATGTWYTRGDNNAELAKVVNTTWKSQSKEDKLELMQDGSLTYTEDGKTQSGTWHFTAIDRLGIRIADDEMFEYDLTYDTSGKVVALDWTFDGYGYDRVD